MIVHDGLLKSYIMDVKGKQQQIEEWCKAMCHLLDRIELAEDMDEVKRLCSMRFRIAKDHGVTVIFDHMPTTDTMQ